MSHWQYHASPDAVAELLRGGGEFVEPGKILEDLGETHAVAVPPGSPHSIAQIVTHMYYWQQVNIAKAKGEPTGFFEKEVARKLDCFGNVCQAFSTYEARHALSDEKPFVKGINSIQMLNDGERWWIASVVWDTERPNNPIPAEYQKK